jgi:hypothetical protein
MENFNHSVSGFLAGGISQAVLFPIDSLKVRFQANGRGERIKIFNNFQVFKQNFHKLYKGLYPGIQNK